MLTDNFMHDKNEKWLITIGKDDKPETILVYFVIHREILVSKNFPLLLNEVV